MKNKAKTKEQLINELTELRQRIAELEKSEEALRKSEEHLRLITDSLPVLISYIDSEQRYRFNNKTYEEWFGHSSKEIYGKHIRDVLGEQAYQTVSKYIETVLSGETITYEDYVPYKDGGMRYIKASYIPHFDEQKKVKGYFSLVSDITGRKQAEENLRKTLAELERSNKELEQFAYVASHDLQEPLRMVASFVSLLEKRYGDKLNTEAKEFINYAVEGSNRLQKLINDLLVYSRLSTRGKSFEPVDCHSILGQIIVNLSVAIEENQAIITNDDLPNVMADSSQMVQLFQNLIENAIRFRSKENPQIHISATEKGDEWVFSVRDNGIGIDPEHFERIFVIFQRLNPRADYPGAGMGLSICKKIVERHGGKIWVNSEPAKGSTFYFTIPKRR
ncbi:MAG TPA: two-component sensor histidine kinase [Elusimicrobia bacterium]|nr:two-component sensor histidine kinase [Elusimicrobiota bacterium]